MGEAATADQQHAEAAVDQLTPFQYRCGNGGSRRKWLFTSSKVPCRSARNCALQLPAPRYRNQLLVPSALTAEFHRLQH